MTEKPLSLIALQKEVQFLEFLAEQAELQGKNTPIFTGNSSTQRDNLEGLVRKLQEQGVVQDTRDEGDMLGFISPMLVLTSSFPAYLKAKKTLLRELQNPPKKKRPPAWVDYNPDAREILLNGVFLLSIPHYGKVNEQVFAYLYQRANQAINTQTMWKELQGVERKPLSNIWSDLGFKGDLARAFFSTSQSVVTFHNPIGQERLDSLGIKKIRISGSSRNDTK